MIYKIKDLQGAELHEDIEFSTKEDIVLFLTDFHNQDYKDESYDTIEELFESWHYTEEQKIEFLCKYGMWEIIDITNI